VRSPVEFAQSHVPGSVNLPILNSEEREQVGTVYKNQGPEAAVALGHQLVSGSVKEARVKLWVTELNKNENSVLTCFRGGMRSQIAQSWCREAGIIRPRVKGGTKALRSFLLEQMNQKISTSQLLVVTGATGAGKSLLLQALKNSKPVLDLEAYARHRGSAFGGFAEPQPQQAVFENRIACDLIRQTKSKKFLIEDESRMIGKLYQPENLFLKLRESPAIFVDESLEVRTQNTFNEYILGPSYNLENYQNNIKKISKKLGGQRTQEILENLLSADVEFQKNSNLEHHKIWITKLLEWYYDPLYFKSLESRKLQFFFRGTRTQVQDFLTTW
jgi:tRNA 2-selenouridine synthase